MSLLRPELAGLTGLTVYALVFGIVFAESGLLVGFFLPGDTVLFAAGLLAGAPGSGVNVVVLAAGVTLAAVTGDAVGYAFGRRAGRPLLLRRTGRWFNLATLERAEAFYRRYGALAVVAARWIPWVRTFTPILAGVGRMPYPRFLAANVVGALTWGAGLVVLGRLAAGLPGLRHASAGVAAAFVVLSVVVGFRQWRRGRAAAG